MLPSHLLDVISNVMALLMAHVPSQGLDTAIAAVSRVLGVGS